MKRRERERTTDWRFMVERWPWGGFAAFERISHDEYLFLFREPTKDEAKSRLLKRQKQLKWIRSR